MQSNTAQAMTRVDRAQDDQGSRKQVWSSQSTHGPRSGEEFPEQIRSLELGQSWGAVGSGLFHVLNQTWGEQAEKVRGIRELKCVWWRARSLEPAGSKGSCHVSSRAPRPRRELSRLGWSMRVGRGGTERRLGGSSWAGRRRWARSRRGGTRGGRGGTQRRRVCSKMRGLSRGRPHSTRACSREVCKRLACSRRACSTQACSTQVYKRRACSREAHSRPAGRERSCCRLLGSRGWTGSSLEHRWGSGAGLGHSSWGHSRGARSRSPGNHPPARRSRCSHWVSWPSCHSSSRWSRQTRWMQQQHKSRNSRCRPCWGFVLRGVLVGGVVGGWVTEVLWALGLLYPSLGWCASPEAQQTFLFLVTAQRMLPDEVISLFTVRCLSHCPSDFWWLEVFLLFVFFVLKASIEMRVCL